MDVIGVMREKIRITFIIFHSEIITEVRRREKCDAQKEKKRNRIPKICANIARVICRSIVCKPRDLFYVNLRGLKPE